MMIHLIMLIHYTNRAFIEKVILKRLFLLSRKIAGSGDQWISNLEGAQTCTHLPTIYDVIRAATLTNSFGTLCAYCVQSRQFVRVEADLKNATA